ncbi:hypothetical protein Tdes44962_MAKER03158 [Teratosphaeria destructans]|uniref:Uncharacterized protein n=1 Tax=Teratosphaeria destructans TaxID=418781 RepID=A0A9W7SR27_9PEZI|nr:hypothetical protein Tdes44962_MAKER03158 [Teratosphaeria destructans]
MPVGTSYDSVGELSSLLGSDGVSTDDSAIDTSQGGRSPPTPSRRNINANQQRARKIKKGVTETALKLFGLMIPAFEILRQNMPQSKGSQIAVEALLAEGLAAAEGTYGHRTFDALVTTFGSKLENQSQRPPKRKRESPVQHQPKRQKRAAPVVTPEPLSTPSGYQHPGAQWSVRQATGHAAPVVNTQVGEQKNQQQRGTSSGPSIYSTSTPDALNLGHGGAGEPFVTQERPPVDFRDFGDKTVYNHQDISDDFRQFISDQEGMSNAFREPLGTQQGMSGAQSGNEAVNSTQSDMSEDSMQSISEPVSTQQDMSDDFRKFMSGQSNTQADMSNDFRQFSGGPFKIQQDVPDDFRQLPSESFNTQERMPEQPIDTHQPMSDSDLRQFLIDLGIDPDMPA